jgi:mRNA interferase MazF
MDAAPGRFDVYLVGVGPAGAVTRRSRRCVVVSPDAMNRHIRTVVVAPLAAGGQDYPTRVPFTFQGEAGHVVLDQLRTVNRARLLRKLGRLSPAAAGKVLAALGELFAP